MAEDCKVFRYTEFGRPAAVVVHGGRVLTIDEWFRMREGHHAPNIASTGLAPRASGEIFRALLANAESGASR